jgi:RimJ/RimL family protein N-acetyltransferase
MTEFDRQSNPEISAGENLSLRLLTEQDAHVFYQLAASNADALEKADIYVPLDVEDAASKATHPMPPGRLDFGIRADGQLIGEIDLVRQIPQRAELIYWIDKNHRGRGYASRAVKALTEHAFSDLGVETLRAWVAGENKLSQKTLETAGFNHVDTNQKTGSFGYELRRDEVSATQYT